MSVDYKSIGARIKAKRKSAGKTQENMAEALFVTVGYISQIERGITKINLETLSEISSFLCCDMTELIAGVSPEQTDYLDADMQQKFRALSPQQKKMLLEIAAVLLAHSEAQKS